MRLSPIQMLCSLLFLANFAIADIKATNLRDFAVERETYGWPLLVIAANHGRVDLVSAILASGADINATNLSGDTATIIASYNGNFEVVELLASHGANLDIRGHDGATALIWAARKGHAEVARTLLHRGANGNLDIRPHGSRSAGVFPGRNGATALIVAVESGYADIVNLLLDAGVNIDATDVSCSSALETAKYSQRDLLVTMLEQRGASQAPECLDAGKTDQLYVGIAVLLALLLILEILHARPGRPWRVAGYLLNAMLLAALGALSLPGILYESIADVATTLAFVLIAIINIAVLAASHFQALVQFLMVTHRLLSVLWILFVLAATFKDLGNANPMFGLSLIVGLIVLAIVSLNDFALRAQLQTPEDNSKLA